MCAHHEERIKELEATVKRLTHDLRNAECAAQLMEEVANRHKQTTLRLTAELSVIREQVAA